MKKLRLISTVVLLSHAASPLATAQSMIQVRGSDTQVNLVQQLSEAYMRENPGASIAVTGGGSGTGIAALTNNTIDIANASRLMRQNELKRALDNGIEPKRIAIAMDGLSVIVNGNNPVDKLTMDQVGAVFRGEITNWAEVGGPGRPITIYGRQSNSGTFVFFREAVLKADYSDNKRRMNGNAQIVEAVKADNAAIGYVGVGYAKEASGITVVSIAAREGAEFATPLDPRDVESGKYPIARPLNQYVNGAPTGAIRDFLKFQVSSKGQEVVVRAGFFPIPQEYRDFNKQSVGIE